MKLLRPILWGVAVLVALLSIIVALAFNASVQTWAARRALVDQIGAKGGVGYVSAGLSRVELTDIKIDRPGFALSLPSLTIELPLTSAAGKNISVKRLVAKGWTVALSVPPAAARPPTTAAATAQSPSTVASTTGASPEPFTFEGVLKLLHLPVDFSLEDIDVEGEVTFQAQAAKPPSRAVVKLTGGNLGVGRDGRFNLVSKIAIPEADAPVSDLAVNSVITVQMDTPRTLQMVSIVTDAKAVGQKFPQGASLHSDLILKGGAKGESYVASLQSPQAGGLKNLFSLDASFPAGAFSLTGKWTVDVANADLAPFTLGLQLPTFSATGGGEFETDRTFAKIHTSGQIDSTIEQLSVLLPELAALGRLRTQLDFDLSKDGDWIRVGRFSAAVSGAKPIASVQALQKFDYDLKYDAKIKGHSIKVADPSVELLRLTLHGLPLAWAQPFFKGIVFRGDDVRGEFFASARNGGFAVRPTAPVLIANLSVSQGGKPLVQALDIAVKMAADSSEQGWQADISEFTVRSGAATLLTATAKAGQPAGPNEPLKATGHWEANLPALLAQPVAAEFASALSQGTASGEFTASLGSTKQISASLELTNLTAPKIENLPRVQASVRLDVLPEGEIDVQVPLVLDVAGRKSDLELTAHIKPGSTTHLEAGVASNAIFVQDLKPLQDWAASLQPASQGETTPAVPAAAEPAVKGQSGKAPADKLPFWNACTGQVKLALKEIFYSPDVKVANVTGLLKVEAGAITLDNIRANLGPGTDAAVKGRMTFDGATPEPYLFSGDATVTGFDPAPFFRAANPKKEPTVEGKFDVAAKLAGSAPNTALLASKITADLNLTSRGGVFRGLALPKAFSDRFQGKSGGLLSNITGVAVGALTGSSKNGNAAATVVDISSLLVAIPYDQLSVQLSHDAAASLTRIQDFTLISPTIRLTGNGSILQQEGVPFMKQPLTAQFELSLHGHAADVFAKQGMVQGGADSLGYSPLFTPVKVDGTLSEMGTEALMNILVQKLLGNATGPLGNLFGK